MESLRQITKRQNSQDIQNIISWTDNSNKALQQYLAMVLFVIISVFYKMEINLFRCIRS